MTTKQVRPEFTVHVLNPQGLKAANDIAVKFSELLNDLEQICGTEGREMAIVRTKLEEAGFYAKRAMASRQHNQQ